MEKLCKGQCCKGHNLPPLQRELFLEWTKDPAHRELRKLVNDLDLTDVNHELLIEKAAEVYGKLQWDDKFRTSPVGRALYGKGPTIRLGADPRLFLNDNNRKLKYVYLYLMMFTQCLLDNHKLTSCWHGTGKQLVSRALETPCSHG
jgi:hypothetical protein